MVTFQVTSNFLQCDSRVHCHNGGICFVLVVGVVRRGVSCTLHTKCLQLYIQNVHCEKYIIQTQMLDILSLNSMAISGFCFNCYLHTHQTDRTTTYDSDGQFIHQLCKLYTSDYHLCVTNSLGPKLLSRHINPNKQLS